MLNDMAKAETVLSFLRTHTRSQSDGAIPLAEFRKACQDWAWSQNLNPPSNRLITRVLREQGYEPQGSRTDWFYSGLIWNKEV